MFLLEYEATIGALRALAGHAEQCRIADRIEPLSKHGLIS